MYLCIGYLANILSILHFEAIIIFPNLCTKTSDLLVIKFKIGVNMNLCSKHVCAGLCHQSLVFYTICLVLERAMA